MRSNARIPYCPGNSFWTTRQNQVWGSLLVLCFAVALPGRANSSLPGAAAAPVAVVPGAFDQGAAEMNAAAPVAAVLGAPGATMPASDSLLLDSLPVRGVSDLPGIDGIATPPADAALEAADWEYVLSALDSMVVALEATSYRLANPAINSDSAGWAIPPEGWPVFDDEILMARLEAMPTPINLAFNSNVRSWIKLYTLRNREGVQRMMGLAPHFFPMIEAELDRRGLPMELKHLPVIESALNPRAVSRQGATGLWQIMYRTARSLGLRIDSYVDERRDPVRSTEAALDYLEDLHRIYDDWLLVVAAYNCGPGNVNKAMRRSGGKRDIWEIFPYLPRETRGYVPAFIAATYTFTYADEHEFQAWIPEFPAEPLDTIMFAENASLAFLAEQLGMSKDELRLYNPALKQDYVPGLTSPYPLRLPLAKATELAGRMDKVLAAANQRQEPVAVAVASRSAADPQYFDKNGYTRLLYTVQSGDNLGFIAEWYDVGLSDLRNWNNIYGTHIRIGQKLAIYKKDAEAPRYQGLNELGFAEKQAREGEVSSRKPSSSASSASASQKDAGDWRWYTVKSGDSLWSISQANPGNTVDGIAKLNGISTRTTLRLGQKLKVRR